jgi:hypothetical protein
VAQGLLRGAPDLLARIRGACLMHSEVVRRTEQARGEGSPLAASGQTSQRPQAACDAVRIPNPPPDRQGFDQHCLSGRRRLSVQ